MVSTAPWPLLPAKALLARETGRRSVTGFVTRESHLLVTRERRCCHRQRRQGIFEYLPISKHPKHFEKLFITPQQAELESVAIGYGARTSRVHTLQALRLALSADVEREGVGVIIATVSRQDNVDRHHEWWSRARTVVEQLA